MEELIESGSDTSKAFSIYAKHWGELKGFSLALQTGKNNLGETAAYLNREVGFGPILLNSSQVTGIDSKGNYLKDEAITWGQYKLNMIKVQKLMIEKFGVKPNSNDQTDKMAALAEKLGDLTSAEND